MPLLFPLLVSTLLFAIGVYGVLARRNAVLVLMGVELMLNAVNLNLLAFDAWHRDTVHSGQILTLFVITIAAAEIGLGLAIVLLVFRTRAQVDVDAVRELADRDATDDAETAGNRPGEGADNRAGEGAGDRAGDRAGVRADREPAGALDAGSGGGS